MSWLFSQALVAEFSGDISLDGEPFAQLNVMSTLQQFWRNDKMMESSRLSRFGLTLRLLTVDLGAELLMSFLAAFPVRTSRLPEKELELAGPDQDYGRNLQGSLAKFDRSTCLLKTAQHSFFEDSTYSSVILPAWGLMQDGELYQQKKTVVRTSANEFGLLLVPTPTACDYKGSGRLRLGRGANNSLKDFCKINYSLLYPPVKAVEWLMWWPIGWTDLKPLAMDKFREWQQQHSPNYRSDVA